MLIASGDKKFIIEKIEKIEKMVFELTEKVFFQEKGFKILKVGLRNAIDSAARHIRQGISGLQNEDGLRCLQEFLLQIRVLDYYSFILRKAGYFSPSQYLQLKKMIKDISERLSFYLKDYKKKNQPGLKEKRALLKYSFQDPNKEKERTSIS